MKSHSPPIRELDIHEEPSTGTAAIALPESKSAIIYGHRHQQAGPKILKRNPDAELSIHPPRNSATIPREKDLGSF
jgi:hypothetical protein